MKADFDDNIPIINDLIELLEEPQEPETAEAGQTKQIVVMPTFTRQETRGPRRQLSADDRDDLSDKLQQSYLDEEESVVDGKPSAAMFYKPRREQAKKELSLREDVKTALTPQAEELQKEIQDALSAKPVSGVSPINPPLSTGNGGTSDVLTPIPEEKLSNPAEAGRLKDVRSSDRSPQIMIDSVDGELAKYPKGFTSQDDLDGDGKIDFLEAQIKVADMKENIQNEVDEAVRLEYLKRFRKEVDFHHKIDFRFERSYKVGRSRPEKKAALDTEIIETISECSEYIEQDPMALFYLLFFCIYYNNEEILRIIKALVVKYDDDIRHDGAKQKIGLMLDLIDLNGLEVLRTIGEKNNLLVYHVVMQEAFTDELRIVYFKIITKSKLVSLRNSDAKHLLMTRDYELMRICLSKGTLRQSHAHLKQLAALNNEICYSFRRYTAAYFEEIILEMKVDQRVAANYRERFLTEPEAIFQVLKMYSKKDFLEHFLLSDLTQVNKAQILELFQTCLKHNSFRVGLEIYLNHLKQGDISEQLLGLIVETVQASPKFLELKLFLIHENFDMMRIEQLNILVDTLIEVFSQEDYRKNPMLSQVNTIKICLLVYRVCWRMENKKIYSLITKCQLLNRYIFSSLEIFLEKQNNIAQLYHFMLEPLLHSKNDQDLLDVMLEMHLDDTLNNPVIVEVLNLVYEGKSSVDSSPILLMQTFQSFFEMKITDRKSIRGRLWQNVATCSENRDKRQSSLQFHIWRDCLEQKFYDECLLTSIIWILLCAVMFQINFLQDDMIAAQRSSFSDFIGKRTFVWFQADQWLLVNRCRSFAMGNCILADLSRIVAQSEWVVMVVLLGTFSSVIQQLITIQVNKNASMRWFDFLLNCAITGLSIVYTVKVMKHEKNYLVTDYCHKKGYSQFSDELVEEIGRGLFYASDFGKYNGFQFILTLILTLFTIKSVKLLERSQNFGYIITMLTQMLSELVKFLAFAGALFLVMLLNLRLLHKDLLYESQSLLQSLHNIFDTINAGADKDRYTNPSGQLAILLFSYIAVAFLMSLMLTMVVIRYIKVFEKLEATKRLEVIRLKNSQWYDPIWGAILCSYFPLNIVLLPFYLPMALLKSQRMNESILKLEYYLLVMFYAVIALGLSALITPLLYLKSLANQAYIWSVNRRQAFPGENLIGFCITLFLGPLLIIGSLLLDFLSMNSVLMRDKKKMELKYQQHAQLSKADQKSMVQIFGRNFFSGYHRFRMDKFSEIQMMQLHLKVFSIIDNFHSFFCRGDKSYKQAAANIKIFNLTKVLGHLCSVPSRSGDIKESLLYFEILSNLLNDIVLYNYSHKFLLEKKLGSQMSIREKVQTSSLTTEDLTDEVLDFMSTQPRAFNDLFNLFNVNVVTRAFTKVDEEIKTFREQTDFYLQKRRVVYIDKEKDTWIPNFTKEVQGVLDKLTDRVCLVQDKKMEAMKRQPRYKHQETNYLTSRFLRQIEETEDDSEGGEK